MAKDPLKFDGKGFSKDELTPEELSELRERNNFFDNHFLNIDDFLSVTGLKWWSDIAKATPAFLKIFAACSIIGGGIMAAQRMGLFQ